MKHIFRFMVVASFATMVACGPSAEQKAAEQAKLDSLRADSIAKVEQARLDSIQAAEAAKLQAVQDSIAKAQADSIAAAQSKKKK